MWPAPRCGSADGIIPSHPWRGTPQPVETTSTLVERLDQLGIIQDSELWRLFRARNKRHSFAVQRLTCWYQAGKDVQHLLPVLSTYLGHSSIAGTQTYLTMTPELLGAASRRFQAYAEPGKEGDGQCHPST